jgi:hypothetical protein
MKITSAELNNIVLDSGFLESKLIRDMFFTRSDGDIKQVFCTRFIRKMGSVRFDGSIGLYFLEFERRWKDSKRNNSFYRLASPSFVISISNFMDLSDLGVFHYNTVESELLISSKYIYDKCQSLPSNEIEFENCVKTGKILGRNMSDYINIYGNSYENDPHLIKTANFVRWLGSEYELFSKFKKIFDE